jgi:hypothetical protein
MLDLNGLVGVDLSDRPISRRRAKPAASFSAIICSAKLTNKPTMMAAYPVVRDQSDEDAVVVAGVNLDWMSKIMGNLGGRPGISAVLVDSTGTVLAAPADQASMIGRPLDTLPLLSAIADKALSSEPEAARFRFTAADGSKRALSFARIAGTNRA